MDSIAPDRGFRSRYRRWFRRSLGALGLVVLVGGILFVVNGLSTSWRDPTYGETGVPPVLKPDREIRVMTWNLRMVGAWLGGIEFRPEDEVRAQLDEIAAEIRAEDPDVVFLVEVLHESGPSPIDQPAYLAEATGMHAWAYGSCYRFGLPFYRMDCGVAVLSRFPIRPLETVQLPGERPFYAPFANRRILWVELDVGGRPVRAAAVWLESFESDVSRDQMQHLVEQLNDRSALLGGDFNARPDRNSMSILSGSGLVTGEFDGDPTFPAWDPKSRIDYVLAPSDWRHVSTRVLEVSRLSDHRPVVSVFELPETGAGLRDGEEPDPRHP